MPLGKTGEAGVGEAQRDMNTNTINAVDITQIAKIATALGVKPPENHPPVTGGVAQFDAAVKGGKCMRDMPEEIITVVRDDIVRMEEGGEDAFQDILAELEQDLITDVAELSQPEAMKDKEQAEKIDDEQTFFSTKTSKVFGEDKINTTPSHSIVGESEPLERRKFEPAEAIIAMLIQNTTNELPVEKSKVEAADPKPSVRLEAVDTDAQSASKKVDLPKVVATSVKITLPENIQLRNVPLLRPTLAPVKAAVEKVESVVKQVSETVVTVLREVPLPVVALPDIKMNKAELASAVPKDVSALETVSESTDELLYGDSSDEPITFKIAEAPLLSTAISLENLLAFPFYVDDESLGSGVEYDGQETLLASKEHAVVEDFTPFSEQLERFVLYEVPEAEQPEVLNMIAEIRTLVAETLDIEELITQDQVLAGLIEQGDDVRGELTAIAELPISETLQIAVTELLQKLGLPEPTEQQIRSCVAKFRAEIMQAYQEQIKTEKINDILHERDSLHLSSLYNFTQTIMSADFHKLLGQLAVYTPSAR